MTTEKFSEATAPGSPPDERTLEFTLDPASAFFDGHFEGDPIFPAVAQLSEVVAPAIEREWPALGRVARLERVKFTQILRPGNACVLTLRRRGERSVEFRITSGGVACAGVATCAEE